MRVFIEAEVLMKKCFDLEGEIKAVMQEIMDYKWLESEKAGGDIGLSKAAQEWISKYYDTWFQYNVKKFVKES